MSNRVIVQAAFAKDGLVIRTGPQLTPAELKRVILDAIPKGDASANVELFDEADDDTDTREFADNENLERGRVFHVSRCRLVEVTVRYAGRTAQRRFPPATRIGRLRRWSVRELGIQPSDANELVLQVAGSSVQPTRDQHVGSFVEQGICCATFDLVRSYTVNGDATLTADHALVMRHLEAAPFAMGELDFRWRLRAIAWPFVFVSVRARDGREFTLRLECDGYPSAPTGAFWDLERTSWLPATRWPRAGSRFGSALRNDWKGGTALYIPCDRNSIAGHEQWLQLHPAWAWDPKVGLARYLNVVWTMLNGEDYAPPAD